MEKYLYRFFVALCLSVLWGCDSNKSDSSVSESSTAGAAPKSIPTDWPSIGRTVSEQRFSPLTQINDANVDKLGIAWYADLPDMRGQEATPIVHNGVMYLSIAWSKVMAFDAVSGKQLWFFDPQVPKVTLVKACCDAVNRGVALWDNKIYVGTLDGRLIALDASTGTQLWSQQTFEQDSSYTITGAPRIVKGLVVIGNGGAEFGVRGFVTAYDAKTGKKVWRFYTVPSPTGEPDNEVSDAILAKVRSSWSEEGKWKEYGGGGTVWDSMVYEPSLDLLYIGVGNGSPWNYQLRSNSEGDNLFLSAIIALRPDTGEYVWHYQETPAESWDFTATQPMILADLTIEGLSKRVIMQAPKNGFFFVLDATTGALISADPYVDGINWAEGYDLKTGRPIINPKAYWGSTGEAFELRPTGLGAHSWHPMSYSPQTGLVYIPANDVAGVYVPPKTESDKARMPLGMNAGAHWSSVPNDAKLIKQLTDKVSGVLVAWDPVRKAVKWQYRHPSPTNGGTLATAGNLVFQGTALGEFKAFSADTGKPLLSIPVQSGVLAGASSYEIDGTQYLAFTTGKGGAYAVTFGLLAGEQYNRVANVARLIVLKLDGEGQLPALPSVIETPFNPPERIGSQQSIQAGSDLFARYCAFCHGVNATSSGVNPDLRKSGFIHAEAAWRSAVIDGVLASRGMSSFSAVMTAEQAEMIRMYVIDQTHLDKQQSQAK